MSTKFRFSYVTGDNKLHRSSRYYYAESLYFAVEKFKNGHNEDCKIIAVKGQIKTQMGTFQIIGVT